MIIDHRSPTLWLLIFTLPAVEQYWPTFSVQIIEGNGKIMMIMIIIMMMIKAIMTMMMKKMTMIMEFTHQLAFLAVTEPNLEQKLDFSSRR